MPVLSDFQHHAPPSQQEKHTKRRGYEPYQEAKYPETTYPWWISLMVVRSMTDSPSPKVRCRDCAQLEGHRCEERMSYMNPDKQRHCRQFRPKTEGTPQTTLF